MGEDSPGRAERCAAAQRCAKCQKPLTLQDRAHLWDGRDYCGACVEASCPGMAAYARTHGSLEEQLEAGRPPGVGHWTLDVLVLSLSVLVSLLGFVLLALVTAGVSVYLLLGEVALLVYVLVKLVGKLTWFERKKLLRTRPTIRVQGGICKAENARRCLWQTDLASCGWELGFAFMDAEIGDLDLIRRRRQEVVLLGPAQSDWNILEEPIACGWTPQMRAIWIGFLTLVGVPQRHAS